MAKFYPTAEAQDVLSMEAVINFDDTAVDVNGVYRDLSAVGTWTFDISRKLPAGATVVGGDVVVSTAWATSTAATLNVGDSVSGTRYASAVDLKSAARTGLTLTGYRGTAPLAIRVALAPTVAAATAGVARVRVEYVLPERSNVVI
jgi:hypothetical protein